MLRVRTKEGVVVQPYHTKHIPRFIGTVASTVSAADQAPAKAQTFDYKIIFFDNDDNNFSFPTGTQIRPGLPEIIQVKVNECGKKSEDVAECARAFDDIMKQEASENVKSHYKAMKHICDAISWENYFDGNSGLNEEILSAHIQKDSKDVIVFDWDRTITMCEGFMFKTDEWEQYMQGLIHHGLENKDSLHKDSLHKIEDHVKALCGGTVRYEMLKTFFGRLESQSVYIVTANPRRLLIFRMMQCMMPTMKNDNVYSTHYQLGWNRNKMWLIQHIIIPKVLAQRDVCAFELLAS